VATEGLADLRVELARACRVMAHRGLVDDVLGHVSHRVGADTLLVRCRGPHERGLRFTVPDDIRLVARDGSGDLPEGWSAPQELALHVGVLDHQPGAQAAVHAHPRAVVTLTLVGAPLGPVVGAFDIPAMRLVEEHVPTFPRAVLVSGPGAAAEMMATMGQRPVCLLRGHGLVTSGDSVRQAVLRALAVDRLARMVLDVHRCGATPEEVPAEDRAALPDLGGAFNVDLMWRHHLACLAADGWDVPTCTGSGAP
jgi:3,4-dihydroxyphthalate decarboxylase